MSQKLLAHNVTGASDAPALVLLHPIATHSAIWAPQVSILSLQFRVICIDLPGHGLSEPSEQALNFADYAERVRDVLDFLGVEHTALVGLSFGGMVAQAFALAWPQRLTALVLAHTSARTEAPVRELWERRIEQFEQQGMEAQVAPTLERWFTRDFAASSPLTLDYVAEQIRATSSAGYVAAIRAIQQLDHLDRLGEITVPTLVIAGAQDSAVPPAVASTLASKISGAQIVVLDQAAHIGCIQQPVIFTETLGKFLLQALSQHKK